MKVIIQQLEEHHEKEKQGMPQLFNLFSVLDSLNGVKTKSGNFYGITKL